MYLRLNLDLGLEVLLMTVLVQSITQIGVIYKIE